VNSNDDADRSPKPTTGAGDAADFRVEFTPLIGDDLFGVFQIHVQGVPIGDGTTTALYPHYQDLQWLARLAGAPGVRDRRRADFGDTFDHLDLHWELTETDIVFTFTGRPLSEWGDPPSWAPPVGQWIRVRTARSTFVSIWNEAQPQFRRLLGQA
jgi:hypothetical protein